MRNTVLLFSIQTQFTTQYLRQQRQLYLRNKETQQTQGGDVDWLCNASLSCILSYYMKAVSKRQNTTGLVTISVTHA